MFPFGDNSITSRRIQVDETKSTPKSRRKTTFYQQQTKSDRLVEWNCKERPPWIAIFHQRPPKSGPIPVRPIAKIHHARTNFYRVLFRVISIESTRTTQERTSTFGSLLKYLFFTKISHLLPLALFHAPCQLFLTRFFFWLSTNLDSYESRSDCFQRITDETKFMIASTMIGIDRAQMFWDLRQPVDTMLPPQGCMPKRFRVHRIRDPLPNQFWTVSIIQRI